MIYPKWILSFPPVSIARKIRVREKKNRGENGKMMKGMKKNKRKIERMERG